MRSSMCLIKACLGVTSVDGFIDGELVVLVDLETRLITGLENLT